MSRKKWFYKTPKLLNWYPPYIGAGIKLESINNERTEMIVSMKLRWFNRNVYGTHFGGSLYAMTDPFFVFIVYFHFGDDYIIWDKAASIKFKRPGKGKVTGRYFIPQEKLVQMRKEVDTLGKKTYQFDADVLDEHNKIVASVQKEIYIRRKDFTH